MKTNKQYKLEAALPHSTINQTTQPELCTLKPLPATGIHPLDPHMLVSWHGHERRKWWVWGERGEKRVLLKQFSKALRPTGVECADNSWPFWSVTSLGSCTSRKREGGGVGGFNGFGPQI